MVTRPLFTAVAESADGGVRGEYTVRVRDRVVHRCGDARAARAVAAYLSAHPHVLLAAYATAAEPTPDDPDTLRGRITEDGDGGSRLQG